MSWSMKWPAPQEMEIMGRPSPASTSGRLCRHGGGEHAERSTPDERAAKREPGGTTRDSGAPLLVEEGREPAVRVGAAAHQRAQRSSHALGHVLSVRAERELIKGLRRLPERLAERRILRRRAAVSDDDELRAGRPARSVTNWVAE